MDFSDVIRNRYSCKKYSDRPVTREVLEKILEAGRLAPTAKNLQEHHIYVVSTPELLAKIDAATPCRYGAPAVLIVTFDRDNVYTYPEELQTSGIEDATIVATHLCLAAANEGVNSCWLNYFKPSVIREQFAIPENEEILMLLDLGYAAEGAGPLANHFSRKDLSETVTFL